MAADDRAYAAARWPWRMTTTMTSGEVREDDYDADFDPLGFARHVSSKPGVERVEVATAFVNGEQVAVAAVEARTQ